jgi:hypothetical protein
MTQKRSFCDDHYPIPPLTDLIQPLTFNLLTFGF